MTDFRAKTQDSTEPSGFLDEVVPAGEAVDRACRLAGDLAKLPAKAYAINKLVTRKESIDAFEKMSPQDQRAVRRWLPWATRSSPPWIPGPS